MKNPYKTLSSSIDYQNKYFKVRKDTIIHPDGRKGTYYVMEFMPSVFIVALTPEKEIYLVNLYRYTTNINSWELPAGKTEGKDLLETAKKELQEETGLVSEKWTEIGFFQVSNGNSHKIAHTFVAEEVKQSGEHKKEEEGINEVIKIPISKAFEMVKKGEMTDADSIAALTQASLYLNKSLT